MTITEIIISIGNDISGYFDAVVVFLYGLKNLPKLISNLIDVFMGSNERFFAWVFAKVIELAVLAYYVLMVNLIPFVWSIAKVLVSDVYAASGIIEYQSLLPDAVDAIFDMMGVYRALDILITAYVTRWVFKFIPYVGR